jgi:hypothetical protein
VCVPGGVNYSIRNTDDNDFSWAVALSDVKEMRGREDQFWAGINFGGKSNLTKSVKRQSMLQQMMIF